MLQLRLILISIFFIYATKTNGQQHGIPRSLIGKTMISQTLEYLEIINDTTIYSSIISYTDTAKMFLRNDTLFIKNRYLLTDQTGTKWMERIYNYKVISLTGDTLQLKNNLRYDYKPPNWKDTLLFVNIENLKEPVTEFKFLSLDYSNPWSGTKHIKIDSLGKLTFIDNPIRYSRDNPGADKYAKPKNIIRQLTEKEFTSFKAILSKSLPSRLPLKRGCPIDGSRSNFEIIIGTRKIKSYGCDLSWTHASLLNYLCEIDQNEELKEGK